MKQRIGVGLLAASLWAMGPPALASNITSNGDFETGDLTGWTLGNGGPFDAVCASGSGIGAATCISQSGNFAMSFGLFGSTATLSQTLNTVVGETYLLSFWLANDNPANTDTETFAVTWGGTTVFSLTSPQPSFAYTNQVVLNLVATSTSTVLQFEARHDPSQWFLDDVAVLTPEPGTGALAGLALATLGLARRFRTRRG